MLLAHLVDEGTSQYVAAARAGGATLVVSGDPDLLSVVNHAGIRVVSPRALLDLLAAG